MGILQQVLAQGRWETPEHPPLEGWTMNILLVSQLEACYPRALPRTVVGSG